MSSELVESAAPRKPAPRAARPRTRMRQAAAHATLLAHGEPMVWLTGGALVVCIAMVVGLLLFLLVQGAATFWPAPLVEIRTLTHGAMLGQETRRDTFRPNSDPFADLADQIAPRIREALAADPPPAVSVLDALPSADVAAARARLPADRQPPAELVDSLAAQIVAVQKAKSSPDGLTARINLRTSNNHFEWINDYDVIESPPDKAQPPWALTVERVDAGPLYELPDAFLVDGAVVASEPEEVWKKFTELHGEVQARWRQRVKLEKDDLGAVYHRNEAAESRVKEASRAYGKDSSRYLAALESRDRAKQEGDLELARIAEQIKQLDDQNDRYAVRFRTVEGEKSNERLADIVRAFPANRLSLFEKLGIYFSRWKEFLLEGPRNKGLDGGVFPAIWGTVAMTLFMSLLVVPFGVLAALYLREYAKAGPITSAVRISINNLAGVPSIVFGVFGLGFFCYTLGASIDNVFFPASVAEHKFVFGTGGLLWASLTLALLTLPVVIVATEEALAAVPNSMREGSYACGASKWQTIWRIVLPRALPGIMTGGILAMARGAGEVAPLMLVGVMPLVPELPVDGVFPFVHAQRSFMHLGFQIYDLAVQSPNVEAAKPVVYTTTLLLIAIIACLNVAAIWLRNRLRRKFISVQF